MLFVLYKIFWICQEAILIFGQEIGKGLEKRAGSHTIE
jgi:hypothetical protein